eukprot:scaffold280234_cov18-Prasinocladus_malaysianus.AAC.1
MDVQKTLRGVKVACPDVATYPNGERQAALNELLMQLNDSVMRQSDSAARRLQISIVATHSLKLR